LLNGFFPKHIGKPFLRIYKMIVRTRLKAKKEAADINNSKEKRARAKVTAKGLKITVNGAYGKYSSKWSFLFAPEQLMHVTLTGQLSLLMLVERLYLKGIDVVSGNTDGIVLKMLPKQEALAESIIEDWEFDTGYTMEATEYLGLYSRDVNNYIAISKDKIKAIGCYADPHTVKNKLSINPTNEICPIAVKAYLKDNVPVEKTINECDDITKFTSIRTVNGQAIKDGQIIGKVIRWYYGADELDCVRYSTNGNKVPRTEGAVPLMELPDKLPNDIDYQWYIDEANAMLKQIGVENVN